jgi:hypothetical protein
MDWSIISINVYAYSPPNWKLNTAIATGVVAFCFSMVFSFSAANEV